MLNIGHPWFQLGTSLVGSNMGHPWLVPIWDISGSNLGHPWLQFGTSLVGSNKGHPWLVQTLHIPGWFKHGTSLIGSNIGHPLFQHGTFQGPTWDTHSSMHACAV